MKYTFCLCLFLFLGSHGYAQQVDVLLLGVSHHYGDYPEQDFSGIYSKIKAFEPEAFFGEFLSKEDERLVMDYWCKQDNLKRFETLKKNRGIAPELLRKTVDSLRALSLRNPEDFRIKADLAHAYYLDQDVANGHYLFWQVFNRLQHSPDVALQNYVDKLLSPELDISGRSMKRLKTSEYAMIAFPVMLEMGMQELFPMDCQDFDLNWSASALAFYDKFESLKKDMPSSQLEEMLVKRESGFEKYGHMGKSSKNVTEWLNTDEASAILASGDFYFPEMYDLDGFPREEMASQIHWWWMRNRGMCDNVVSRARALGLDKVVVVAGANHRKYMQDIFSQMSDVTVSNINEIE